MKKLFSIMLGRCFALAFLLFFSGKSFAENDNYTRAADTFKAIEKLYGVEDVPLFRETYPFDNHLKVSYLSNQEQAEQQKLYSYLWPFSGSLSAVTALLEVKPKSDFRKVLTKTVRPGLEMYLDTRRTPTAYASYINTAPVSDRFYDDNIWIGLDFTDLYLLTGKKEYLSQAKMVWRFIESGTDDKLGYGIYWCEQKKNGKNTCSNAPGSVYASKLFLATGDSSYLQAGIRLYEWTKENLQDPADGLYFDNKSLNGEIGRAKFAYNSGQMMQSAALLYLGICYFEMKNYTEAYPILTQFIAANQQESYAYAMRARALAEMGRYNEAETDIVTAIALEDTIEYRYLEGLILFKRGNYKKAQTTLEKIASQIQTSDVYKFLGLSYYATGDLKNALLNLDKAIILSNDDADLKAKYNEVKAKLTSQG